MTSRTKHLLQRSFEEEELEYVEGVPEEIGDQEENVIDLVSAKQDLDSNTDYLEQTKDVANEVADIKEASEVVNVEGGVSQEALAFFNIAVNRICKKIGMERPSRLPTLESFSKSNRVKISIEELEDIENRVQQGIGQFKGGAKDALKRLLDALSTSVPEAHKRIERLIDRVKSVENNTERPKVDHLNVVFGDGLNIALSVDGKTPESFTNYFGSYCQLGHALLCDYNRVAINNALKTTSLPDLFTYSNVDVFNKTIEDAVCGMEDPRTHLTSDQKTLALPSTQSLFVAPVDEAEADKEEDDKVINPKIEWINKFIHCYPVNTQIHNPGNINVVSQDEPGYGHSPLCVEDCLSLARQFNKLYSSICLSELIERHQTLAKDSFEVADQLYDRFKSAEDKIKVEIEATFNLLLEFVETVFKLAHWPVLNYLTNLVLTSNAVVLYAERSIALPEGGVAVIEESEPVEEGDGADDSLNPDDADSESPNESDEIRDPSDVEPEGSQADAVSESDAGEEEISDAESDVSESETEDESSTDDTSEGTDEAEDDEDEDESIEETDDNEENE